jgi:DnaJ-class molecular chaperone
MEALLRVLISIRGASYAYYKSLELSPWVQCSKCHGKSERQGWLFSYSHHICPRCQGTGQQQRLGRKLLKWRAVSLRGETLRTRA